MPRRRVAALAACFPLAIGLLYAHDWYQARWLAGKLDAVAGLGAVGTAEAKGKSSAGLDRRLAIGRYLESAPAPPLEVFDAIAAAAPASMNLTGWQYAQSGAVTVTGTVPNAGELEVFMKKLGETGVLTAVEPKRIQVDPQSRACQFEVAAALAPRGTPPATQPAATQPATQAGGPRSPATGPASPAPSLATRPSATRPGGPR